MEGFLRSDKYRIIAVSKTGPLNSGGAWFLERRLNFLWANLNPGARK
jgi:hypothetical protein